VETHDVAVIGAGIVGLAVAREVLQRRPTAKVLLLEKASDVAAHQTGHNSGVIHGGIYYEPGSLKARLCVEGARLMYEYCHEHAIPHQRCGKLIVAIHDSELLRLDTLEQRGRANAVPGLRRVSSKEIREIEPNAVGVGALHAPNTGIVDYGRVSRVIRDELTSLGAELHFDTEVTSIDEQSGVVNVRSRTGAYRAKRLIVCAGLWSDRLARSSHASADPRIVPFRGAYLRLKPSPVPVVRGMVYPVPDPALPFLGVHVTKHIDGHVMLGPTAMMVPSRDGYKVTRVRPRDLWETATWPGSWRVARKFWRVGLTEMRLAASRKAFVDASAEYVPGITLGDVEKTIYAGVRAQAVQRDGTLVDDFVISTVGSVSHVRNAPSPAATSAFALAREILDRVGASGARS
jgi:L-2-hydroxyglutarate oxidase